MSVNNLLLWEKWRPKNLDDLILLPRIQNHFKDGVNQNFIFYGHYGTGKTSLARILIGKYTKDKPFLELNSSLFTSIDVLRNEIEDFCKFTPMMSTDSDIKYIFLDEFERVSSQFQDAFKAFIEKYNKNVRFIITTNPKEDLISIITKKFPDFRSIIVEVQNYISAGGNQSETVNVSTQTKSKLYEFVTSSDVSYEQTYHFLMSGFGPDKIDVMIQLLGKPFIEWYMSQNKPNVEKLFNCNYIISDYGIKLSEVSDPIVLGMTIIGKFRDVLN